MDAAETARMVEYLSGHATDDDGRNPHGQDYVIEMLEEMDRKDLEAVAFQALWSLANEHDTCIIPDPVESGDAGHQDDLTDDGHVLGDPDPEDGFRPVHTQSGEHVGWSAPGAPPLIIPADGDAGHQDELYARTKAAHPEYFDPAYDGPRPPVKSYQELAAEGEACDEGGATPGVSPGPEASQGSRVEVVKVWHLINQLADEEQGIDGNVIRGWLDGAVRSVLLGTAYAVSYREAVVSYDPEAGAAYVSVRPHGRVERTASVHPHDLVMFDYDVDGRLVGVEVLGIESSRD